MPEVATETIVWNVDSQRYSDFVSKFHLNRGDSTAKCSPRILLNLPIRGRAIGIGGSVVEDSYGDGGWYLDGLDRDQICRRCVPVLPSDSTEPESD